MSQWKDLEEKIVRISEKDPIPKSLSPKEMEKKLKIKEAELKEGTSAKTKRITYLRWASAAAAFVLVFAVSLSLLGKYNQITGEKETLAGKEEKTEEMVEKIPGAESYEMIFDKVTKIQKAQEEMASGLPNGAISDQKSEGVVEDVNKERNHSTTNLQEEGVGEADQVITDGNYFYIQRANNSNIAIVEVKGGEMETISQIFVGKLTSEEEVYLHEFYVNQDKLYLLATRYEYKNNKTAEETLVITYDISDRANPKEIGTLTQSGSYDSSRLADGYLYVFSDFFVYDNAAKDVPESFVPMVEGEAIPCRDICIPENVEDCQYKVMTSMEIKNPTGFVEEKAVLCGRGIIYVSEQSIYFTSGKSVSKEDEYNQTEIWKFVYGEGKIVGSATGFIKGQIRDQFALSESNDYLRVVTTYQKLDHSKTVVEDLVEKLFVRDDMAVISTEDQENGLYVLDSELNQVGAIENLAKGEQVYSARFFEQTGYFVTFRQTDPLFSVDLSDPTNPTVLGELKIPGFSEYLHPYGEGLLLGLGYEADENGRQTGIKLSMFDVSDPSNVKEVATQTVAEFSTSGSKSAWADCDAMYDHKKILVDVEKNIIGFRIETNRDDFDENGKYQYFTTNNYAVYGYDVEKGFYEKVQDGYLCVEKHNATKEQKEMNQKKNGEIRGVYIGQYLYAVHRNFEIRCYDMKKNYELVSQYEF